MNKTIGVDRVMSRIHRDLGYKVEVATVVEWMGDVADAIELPAMHDEAVSFIAVKDYKAQLPDYTRAIIQIAKNTTYKPDAPFGCLETTVECIEEEKKEKPCAFPCYEWDKDDTSVWQRSILDLQLNYVDWINTSVYNRVWVPVRLSTHKFFKSMVCTEKDAELLYQSCEDEYSIEGDTLRFSFKEGLVAVAHVRTKVDEQGLPLFPDNMSFLKAVTAYVRYMLAQKEADRDSRQMRKVEKAEQDYHWYIQQAKNKLQRPGSIDEMENRSAMQDYLLPRQFRYQEFFGTANKYESRSWNKRRTWRI